MTFSPSNSIDERRQQLALDRLTLMSPVQGLAHAIVHGGFFLALVASVAIFWQHDFRLAILVLIPLAIVYTAIFVTAHDCVHQTYTGIKVFDEQWSLFWTRLAWWPQHSYRLIHHLHHEMVGQDYNDPERVTYLKSEFESASWAVLCYIRHQWLLNIFCFGGVGFVINYWKIARRNCEMYPQLIVAMRKDFFGCAVMFCLQLGVANYFGLLGEYLVSFFVVERIAGGFLQFRALCEHYGLWSNCESNVMLSRIRSSRNVRAGVFSAGFLMTFVFIRFTMHFH